MEILNFRSFSFLKEFFFAESRGEGLCGYECGPEAESVVAGSLYWDLISKMKALLLNGASILPGLSVLRLK